MTGEFSGKISVEDDTEPLEIQKHAPIVSDNVDMRIIVLKEYISKVPDATLKDLKKSLNGFTSFTDDEFKGILKSANSDKYSEIYPIINESLPVKVKRVAGIKKGSFIIPWSLEEIKFAEKHRSESRTESYILYQKEFPNSTRKLQWLYDYYHHNPAHAPKSVKVSNIRSHAHTQLPVQPLNNYHILAQAINSLYKSGKSPKLFSQIKPVIELIEDPKAIEFAIECLTS